ncbi:probable 18S rRNA (guanine-N(7))-methyltransferase [Galendromus occidentalis]|uniref:18S rRNA (guanine-N(7))-methyltransferase n=1 Tax=Galendromus occidentalis TaxID=34638 RepID=A0AAJ7WJ59_9ACAR|nr:probable 18S rRNA (guanine-N(7))-methyltransferase [Galendromus occidentalis]
MARRPEYQAPPEIFYNESEAKKYSQNSRIIGIQSEMSERALELLALPEDAEGLFLLDIGCGSGLSGESISEQGHHWIGMDISAAMLEVAIDREVRGDLIMADMGDGVPFRAGTFDGAISISALQWLCNVDKSYHHPVKRLAKFFSGLYAALSRGSRAVFQFYPESGDQVDLITQQAMKAGFTGGLVIDYPNSAKAKKMFLVLFTGGQQRLPSALGTENEVNHAQFTKREKVRTRNSKNVKSRVEWIKEKKERRRKQGKEAKPDTKYTGRRRAGHGF